MTSFVGKNYSLVSHDSQNALGTEHDCRESTHPFLIELSVEILEQAVEQERGVEEGVEMCDCSTEVEGRRSCLDFAVAARPPAVHHSEAAERFLHFHAHPCGRLCHLRHQGIDSTALLQRAVETNAPHQQPVTNSPMQFP